MPDGLVDIEDELPRFQLGVRQGGGVLVVQHADARSPGYLPGLLARATRLAVKHAESDEALRAGTVYVAPPGLAVPGTPALFGLEGRAA